MKLRVFVDPVGICILEVAEMVMCVCVCAGGVGYVYIQALALLTSLSRVAANGPLTCLRS